MATYRLTEGDDTRTGTTGADVFDAYFEDDQLGAAGGMDVLSGRGGNDTFLLGSPTAFPFGGIIDGGADVDTIHAYGFDLGTFSFQNVEVLSLHYAEFAVQIAQLNAFSTISAVLPATAPVTLYLQGQGGTLDLAGRVEHGRGVHLNGLGLNSSLVAIGTAFADEFYGTQFDDTLRGADGADVFLAAYRDGTASGTDQLFGDGGADTFHVRKHVGTINGGAGTDTVIAYQFDSFGNDVFGHLGNATFVSVERLVTGTRTTFAHLDQINSFTRISAGIGEQAVKLSLIGEGGTIDFGAKVTAANQFLWFRAYEATSAVIVTGTARTDAIVGSEFADRLGGGAGNDEVAGADFVAGAMGRDTLIGGTGDDTFYVDASDTVVESTYGLEGGVDTVRSFTSFDLAGPRVRGEVENLTLLGYLGSENQATYGYGNGMSNVITGHDGDNRIDGRGGVDTMIGGDGDDVYFVDNIGDVVQELFGEGSDSVLATVSFDLTSNNGGAHYIERLVLQGSSAIDGYGSEIGNEIRGNSAANILDGREGVDTMIGGLGNDTYYVDDQRDRVIEKADGGIDRVIASTSFSLKGGHIEVLELVRSENGRLVGNGLNNVLLGNAGDNILNGGGGSDTLTGGEGQDRFVFKIAPAASNVDLIMDFDTAADLITLHDEAFPDISGRGRMSDEQFAYTSDGEATIADHRIIYNETTGALFFDADGSGAGAKVQFARIGLFMTDLTANDFVIV